jgi:F-type H+-transporting ATPase subunit gamma
MASLREIRRKIKSIKSTQQITKAMKMVAAARLRRSQTRIINARPFAQKMEDLVANLVQANEAGDTHKLLAPRTGATRVLLALTSDKGLCGAFNTNLLREALRYLRRHKSENVRLFVVGRKGRDYFKRIGVPVEKEYVNIPNVSFVHAELITSDLLHAYESLNVGAVDLLYNEFKSVIFQKVMVKQLLPVPPAEITGKKGALPDFIFEPSKEHLLEGLIGRFLRAQVFRVLLESTAAELGARMAAMDNATRNAKELIGSLTLQLNRTRQASITKEILEVVSGAEALK